MKHFGRITHRIVLFLLIPTLALSAGKLKGKILDAQNKDPMIGANVLVVGTSIGAVADIYGAYMLPAVPAGKYTVRCSYIGYLVKTLTVTIVDNQTSELDFSLSPDIIKGEEVVISAQAFGQAAAINQQVASNTIVNVISEQKIKELPDANAAEAIGRLPGVSLIRSGGEANKIILRGLNQNMTTITVDGIKLSPTDADSRGVDLSTISQGSLSGIVLSKAVTSDMEAEAIAGNVNFVTKTAPEIRDFQIDALGSYGAMDKTYDQYNYLGRYGERFFDNFLGVQLFGNIEKRNRSSEEYTVDYDQSLNQNKDYQISNFTIRYTPETRKRRGIKLLLDIATPDEGVIKLNGELNRTERRLTVVDRNYPTLNGSMTYNFRGQDINTDIKNISLQGMNNLAGWQINWNMSYVESNSETPYLYDINVQEPSSMDGQGNIISGMRPVPFEYRKGTGYENLIPFSTNNFNMAFLTRGYARTSSNLDYEKTLFLDAKKSYTLLDMTGELKFGGKYRSKYHRRYNTLGSAMYYNGVTFYDDVQLQDGSIVPKDLARYGYDHLQQTGAGLILATNFIDQETRNVYGKYMLNPILSAERMRAWYDLNIHGINSKSHRLEYTVDKSETGTNYDLNESVTAGYLMNTLNMGTFATLIAGVRIEADNNRYNALLTREAISEYSQFTDTASTHQETVILPNFHLIFKPSEELNVRFAAFRGINRPNFNYRLPTYVFGTASENTGSDPFVILSNTNLKNATAWNFETNVQLFSNTIGLVSLSAFYKNISNEVHQLWLVPITSKATTDSLGVRFPDGKAPFSTSYQMTFPYNSDKPTRVWGIEVEHQANLRFLPGLLSNLILSYNVSVIKSETYTPAQEYIVYYTTIPGFPFPVKQTETRLYEEKTRIANSPEVFGNLSLGYDIGGFSARVSYFYQGEYYNGYSGDGTSDNIQKAFSRVDLSVKQSITDYLSVGVNVNNINDAEEGRFLENTVNGWRLESSSYRYGTTADLWLRITM
ncbi:MAG TPA: TonB-dependent receptor [Bacteroidota bacterium]|nr:TonB-dependent receptor [Bacteroidota bacterium]